MLSKASVSHIRRARIRRGGLNKCVVTHLTDCASDHVEVCPPKGILVFKLILKHMEKSCLFLTSLWIASILYGLYMSTLVSWWSVTSPVHFPQQAVSSCPTKIKRMASHCRKDRGMWRRKRQVLFTLHHFVAIWSGKVTYPHWVKNAVATQSRNWIR